MRPLLVRVHRLGRRLELPDPSQRDRSTIRFESELVLPAVLIGRAADDADDLEAREITDLPACAVGRIERRHRQAVDLGPILRVQLHAVDVELIEVCFGSLAVFAREGDDVAVVVGIIERDGEARPALLAVEISDRPAGKIAPRDFQGRAFARHQRIEVDVRLVAVGIVRRLRNRWSGGENGNSE